MTLVYSSPLVLSKSFPSLPSSPRRQSFGGEGFQHFQSKTDWAFLLMSSWSIPLRKQPQDLTFLWLWAKQVIASSVPLFHSRKEIACEELFAWNVFLRNWTLVSKKLQMCLTQFDMRFSLFWPQFHLPDPSFSMGYVNRKPLCQFCDIQINGHFASMIYPINLNVISSVNSWR